MAGIESNLAGSPVLDVVDRGTQPPVRSGAAKLQAALGGRWRLAPYDVVRFVLAATLLPAAALKGYQLATSHIAGTDLFSSRWFLIAVVEFEMCLGFWLLGGQFPRQTRYLTLACFAAFGAVSLFRALRGDASCGCFGSLTVSPWLTAMFDATAITALLACKPSAPKRGAFFSLALPLIFPFSIGVPAAVLVADHRTSVLGESGEILGDGQMVVMEPATWIGRRFPLLPHIDAPVHLDKGRWLVLLYHHDCPRCKQVVREHEQVARRRAGAAPRDSIALIQVPPLSQEWRANNGSPRLVRGHLDDSRRWFITTPVELVLHDGVVSAVRDASELGSSSRLTRPR